MRGDLRAQALRSRGDLPSYLLQGDPLSGCARVSSKIQGDGGWRAGGVYVRERRNRDRDNRRLWGDLRRSRPSRKEESEWTMIAPATYTLNNSANFALTEFYEVRKEIPWLLAPALRFAPPRSPKSVGRIAPSFGY